MAYERHDCQEEAGNRQSHGISQVPYNVLTFLLKFLPHASTTSGCKASKSKGVIQPHEKLSKLQKCRAREGREMREMHDAPARLCVNMVS